MSNKVNEQASGKITLYNNSYESASGHNETSSMAEIYAADGGLIELKVETEAMVCIGKKYHRHTLDFYRISVKELEQFIKEHGTKIDNEGE